MKKLKKEKQDRLLRVADSSMSESDDLDKNGSWPQELVISGDLDLGKSGNPVTILIEDEVTGETMEINNVRSAFLAIEDTRRSTTGWLAMAIGGIEQLSDTLNFLSKTTLESLKRLTRRNEETSD